jgi:hypothetical protein
VTRIRPITKEEIQEILDENLRVLNLIKQDVGPTSWSDLRKMLGINQVSLDNALQKGVLLSPLSRGSKRTASMSGADALRWLTRNFKKRDMKSYAQTIRRSANKLDSDD